MEYRKSCGFVVFKNFQDEIHYLIIRAWNGEYGFPKGHVENDESEYETAIRELKEETNVEVQILNGFRQQIEYKFPNRENLIKQSVYFLGEWIGNDIKCQEKEVSEAKFVTYVEALELLTFDETKGVLKKAHNFIEKYGCNQ